MDCVFCKVVSGELPGKFLYEDDDAVVFADIHPQAPVHLLVVPKQHVSEFGEADENLLSKLLSVIKKIISSEKITNYRVVVNGRGAALIDHLHWHVLGQVDKLRKL